MAYFRWVEGEMDGHLIATDEGDARRQLEDADSKELVITRIEGPLDAIDFHDAEQLLGDLHAALFAARRLGLSLTETPQARSSHFGGLPRLSAEHTWPGANDPLPLLLELDLAELAKDAGRSLSGLPETGYLALFFDPRAASREFAVRYSGPDAEVRSAPAGCPALEPRNVVGGLELSSPHPEDPSVVELFGKDVELLESYAALYEESADPAHQLLGHAYWLNGPGDVADGMLQLLQIRGEPGWFGVNAQECYLNVLIPETDLVALDFKRCQLVLQVA